MLTRFKIVGVLGIVGMFGLASSAFVAIDGTPHDLAVGGEVCNSCHAPHDTTTDGPLWVHDASTVVTYTMYASTSFDMTYTGGDTSAPGAASTACLSCHDGSIAYDSFPGGLGTTFMPAANKVGNAGVAGTTNDLSSEHPIGMGYLSASDTAGGLVTETGSTAVGALRLFAGDVECGTCHDPHDNTNTKFLRIANTNSDLCTNCHNK
jgi:predicted CXXCH cytochrome family protein